MKNRKITFKADRVKVRNGKPDNSADVVFEVGEYSLDQIKELLPIVDKELKITVEFVI